MTSQNFAQVLESQAKSNPDLCCIQVKNEKFSYSEIDRLVDSFAAILQDVPKGEGIAIVFPNNHLFLVSLFAVLKAECVALPVDIKSQKEQLEDILKQSKIKYILSGIDLTQGFNIVKRGHKATLYEAPIKSNNIASLFPDAAFIRFTSGTTGEAKGVVISHKAVFQRTHNAQKTLQFVSGKKMLWLLPMAFHFVVSLCLYVRYCIPIVIKEGFLAEDLMDIITTENISYIYGSPIHIKILSSAQPQQHTLDFVISTTSGLSSKDALQFQKNFSVPVIQAFGVIEVGLPLINTINALQKPDAVGHMAYGNNVYVLNAEGRECGILEEGSLAIEKNEGMFSGYLNPQTSIDQVLKNNCFYTGDIAQYDRDKAFYIKGRAKNVIMIAGTKVFPETVEYIINDHEAVHESRVYAKKHALFGDTITADVVLKKPITEEKLRQYLKEKLPANHWPNQIHFVDHITKTSTGKIKR